MDERERGRDRLSDERGKKKNNDDRRDDETSDVAKRICSPTMVASRLALLKLRT